jgi:hypothetical protein
LAIACGSGCTAIAGLTEDYYLATGGTGGGDANASASIGSAGGGVSTVAMGSGGATAGSGGSSQASGSASMASVASSVAGASVAASSGAGGAGGSGGGGPCGGVANAATGQLCPLFSSCSTSAECGVFQGCNQWFCNPGKQCELNTTSNCGKTLGGACSAGFIVTQYYDPPVEKDFQIPDGINFREVATINIELKNTTGTKYYLDEVPLTLELAGNGSGLDVAAVKMYADGGGTDYSSGDQYVTLTDKPFASSLDGKVTAGAAFSTSGILAGKTKRFVITLAFAKEKTYIEGRSYRLKIPSTVGFKLKESFSGPVYSGTMCGIPAGGYAGAWVHAKKQ